MGVHGLPRQAGDLCFQVSHRQLLQEEPEKYGHRSKSGGPKQLNVGCEMDIIYIIYRNIWSSRWTCI